MHVIARSDAGRGVLGVCERMSCILRNSALIHESDWAQHGATVLVEQNVLAHGLADDFQADSLCFQRGCMRAMVVTLDRGAVHEIELEVSGAPFLDECAVGL